MPKTVFTAKRVAKGFTNQRKVDAQNRFHDQNSGEGIYKSEKVDACSCFWVQKGQEQADIYAYIAKFRAGVYPAFNN